jgi:DNA-3-methyladenine glycosylase I
VVTLLETASKGNTAVVSRCAWVPEDNQTYVDYHDHEWGKPVYDDRLLFEFLTLEGAQAGLSWSVVLSKREGYRRAFDGFDMARIAEYDGAKVAELLADPGIVRNRLKVAAAITNARCFLEIVEEYGSFSECVWRFVGGKPKKNAWRTLGDIPSSTPESDAMSKFLVSRGFKFVGSTTCYAFMQAVGMVNDHTIDCFRYDQV